MKRIVSLCILLCVSASSFSQTTKQHQYTFSLDALYWKLREGSADNWAQILDPAGTHRNNKVLEVPFPYRGGFRLGLTYTHPNNISDTSVFYTSYQSVGTSSASGRVYSAFLGNFFAGNTDGSKFGPYYDHSDIRWTFAYKTLDLRFGRHFATKSNLSLHPFVGFKAALIHQNMFSNWDTPRSDASPPVTYNFTHASEDLQNDFVGIGPAIGTDTSWLLYQDKNNSLNLIGNVQGALMWGFWRFKDTYRNNASSGINTITIHNNNFNSAATMAGALLGLEWQQSFTKTDMKLRLGYEAQVWFSQMQYYSYNMGRLNNLMSLQGGTLSMSVSA